MGVWVTIHYNIFAPWKTLDPWQKRYIETEGNCHLLCGRQSGKSAAAAIKVGKRAATKKDRRILMIAFTENQAYALFFKALMYLEAVYPKMIMRGKDKPTKHEINLTNGTIIYCYAAGKFGDALRHHTLTDLFIDEAAPMAKEIWEACSPMLSITGGSCDMLSTPRGKAGFFYDCSLRDDFTKFKVTAYECPRHKPEFLENEKKNMSKLAFAQEYMADFLDDLHRVFSDNWIKKVCTLKRSKDPILKHAKYYLGCDIARMGEDLSTFEIIHKIDKDHLRQIDNITTKKTRLTETESKIIELTKEYKFKKIYIDAGSGGMGVSVLDHLLLESITKRKIVAINNRQRLLDDEGEQKKKILKEELYSDMVWLGESGKLLLLDDDELRESLASVQYEYNLKAGGMTTLHIFGKKTHIAEGLIRACHCIKDKTLSIWAK